MQRDSTSGKSKRQGRKPKPADKPSANGKTPRKPRQKAGQVDGQADGHEARKKAAYGQAERERLAAEAHGQADAANEVPDLEIETASAGRTERTSWLWKDRLEWSSVSIMQGEKGAGKSTWLRAITAHVTGGPRLPGEKGPARILGDVLWFAGEEPRASKVHPGLAAAGANMAHVHTSDHLREPSKVLLLPTGFDRLARLIRQVRAVLVVIDPIFAFLDGTIDVESGTIQARQFTGRLARLAKETGVLVLYSRNLTKGRHNSALDAGRGSGELANASRSVLHCHSLPHSSNAYGLASITNGGRQAPTLLYSIEDSGGQGVIRVNGSCTLTADELAGGEDADLERSQLDQAKALIRQMIPKGELSSAIVWERAEIAGIARRTLQLAAQRLGMGNRREGSGEQTIVYWIAPPSGYK